MRKLWCVRNHLLLFVLSFDTPAHASGCDSVVVCFAQEKSKSTDSDLAEFAGDSGDAPKKDKRPTFIRALCVRCLLLGYCSLCRLIVSFIFVQQLNTLLDSCFVFCMFSSGTGTWLDRVRAVPFLLQIGGVHFHLLGTGLRGHHWRH